MVERKVTTESLVQEQYDRSGYVLLQYCYSYSIARLASSSIFPCLVHFNHSSTFCPYSDGHGPADLMYI